MVNTEGVIKRFLSVVNSESKEAEKDYLCQSINNLLNTSKFHAKVESEGASNTTYRIDFDNFHIPNFGLTYNDVEEVLNEYKDAGYRCSQIILADADKTVPNSHTLSFQIFIRVVNTKQVIDAIPVDVNYILPNQCSIVKV